MGAIMNSSAETKKPPLAPKPKFLVGSKPAPPPVAPKPDAVVSNVLSTKTSKPAIAPKPKVPKGSPVPDTRLSPSRKNFVSLEEHKQESSEHSEKRKCQNGDDKRTPYILPVYTSNTECILNCGNENNSCVKHIVLERLETLENLENINIGDPLSVPKAKCVIQKCDAHSEKVGNRNQVVLKASLLEEKLKDVFFTPIGFSPTTSPLKHRPTNSLEMDRSCDASEQFNIEIVALSQPLSGFDEVLQTRNCHVKFPEDGIQILETSQDCPEVSINGVCSSDGEAMENDQVSGVQFLEGESQKSEVEEVAVSGKPLAPCSKNLPTPKPRVPRTARLMRQAYVDAPGDSSEERDISQGDASSSIEQQGIKSNKITLPGTSILGNHEPGEKEERGSKSELTSDSRNRKCTNGQDVAIDQSSVFPQTSHNVERVEDCPPTGFSFHPEGNTVEDGNVSPHVDRRASFIKCNKQSMSLPTQLKPTYNQHLPAPNSLHGSPSKTDKDATISDESPIKVAPKKPQRHSLPAAGRLKKAASEELLENSSYSSYEARSSEGILDKSCLRHLTAKEHGMSSSFDMPKLIKNSEKPVWKLPHPILPFPGNPESLKSSNLSSNSESFPSLTKPRAKSLSAVDMDRCNKPCKDPQKKSSLKKLLNMKLSICFMKSDFQKFLSKGSQVGEMAPGRPSSREGRGIDNSQVDEKRSKPVKAHSAETYSPASHKKKKMYRSQVDLPNGPKAESLDDQILSRGTPSIPFISGASDCGPEYENICRYEETPEYENLPFTLAPGRTPGSEWQNPNTTEDSDTNVYEMEDPYVTSSSQLQQAPRPLHSRSSHEDEGDPDLTLGDLPSDEEEAINSSDEDASSDSSKGEPDSLEDKQGKGTGKRSKVYLIAKEIMSSEKVFVDVLKLLHIDFRDAVAQASRQFGKPVIEDRILNQILYYLPQLYELNRDLLKELEERMLNWIEQQRIADIFVKKGPYLKMYSTYIKEFDKNVALLDEQCKKNPGFATVVKDFEMSPRCANLAIKHYLLKPVQRIPQYRLLLTDYLKNLLEDSADYRDTQDALAVVIEVANHANDIMKQGDNFQKLMQIQYSLSGHHEIVQPGRVFLKEGTLMKLSRKVMQPRMFFLFNDALLYTTPVQSGMYKLNNMLSLAGMKVRKPTQEAYQNELKIESVERSFILSASSATERDEWLEAISQSIEEYAKKKITFCPSRSLDETDMDKKEEMSPLGSKAPIWIPDTRATMCMVCTSEFTLTWRRHHCRACGKIVCQACSSNKCGLDYLKNQPARVCEHCFKELQKLDHQNSSKTGSPANHKSPSSALSSVLHSIPSGRKQKKIPAALKEVSANTEDSTMSGYLYRSKGSKKPWKHFWFVIKNKVLYTYAASEDVAALESQPLLGFTVAEVHDENSQSKVFQLLHKNVLFYIFKADDAHSAQKWIEAFQEGTVL